MKEKLYGAEDINKKFRYLEGEINKLACTMQKCCVSLDNIGNGFELYKGRNGHKEEIKTLLAGNNITLQDTGFEIVINSTGGGGSFDCTDLLSCSTSNLPEGTNLYFTNERAQDAVGGILTNTSQINLTYNDTLNTISATFFSNNVSQFTNDAGYITSTGASLTNTYVGFGSNTNTLTGSANFIYDSTNQVFDVNFGVNSAIKVDIPLQYAAIENSLDKLELSAGTATISAAGGTSLSLDRILSVYSFGAVGFDFNTHIYIDDTVGSKNIQLNSTNGVIVSNLSGGATEMVVADNTGLLSKQAIPTGTVTSVDLTMPSAFSVSGNPITTSGTLAVTGAGLSSQYIKGDGTLANFPDTGSAGGVTYYFNGGVASDIVGDYQMSKVPDTGLAADFTKTGDGLIVTFATDAGDPDSILMPGGLWVFRSYCSMSVNGGSPQIYAVIKVFDGIGYTTIATGSNETINGGTGIDLYTFGVSVPSTTIANTDRIVIEFWLTNSGGKTITFYTQDGRLNAVQTTFTAAITALNGLTDSTQFLATGSTGTDFNIVSSTATHTFNIPTASASNRGLLSTSDWSTFNSKEPAITWSQGDILYGTGVNVYTKLAKNTSATRYLSNTGTSNNPAWAQIDLTNGVTGVLASGNGGNDAWIDYSATSTIVGWSSFTTKIIRYQKSYKRVTLEFNLQGTSNSTTTTFTLPIALGSSSGNVILVCYTVSNGATPVAGRAVILTSGTTVTLSADVGGTAFAGANNKQCVGTIEYEID